MGLKEGYCIFVEGIGEGLGMGTGGEGVSKMGEVVVLLLDLEGGSVKR